MHAEGASDACKPHTPHQVLNLCFLLTLGMSYGIAILLLFLDIYQVWVVRV